MKKTGTQIFFERTLAHAKMWYFRCLIGDRKLSITLFYHIDKINEDVFIGDW